MITLDPDFINKLNTAAKSALYVNIFTPPTNTTA